MKRFSILNQMALQIAAYRRAFQSYQVPSGLIELPLARDPMHEPSVWMGNLHEDHSAYQTKRTHTKPVGFPIISFAIRRPFFRRSVHIWRMLAHLERCPQLWVVPLT
jgi:hypothetical protein